MLPLLNIAEGAVLDYNLCFRVIFGEFMKSYEGTYNKMISRTIESVTLGLLVNVQEGIRCFHLATCRVFQTEWKDAVV